MLTQLSQSGVLARVSGLVFGELPSCDEPGGAHAIRDVLREFVADFDGPVLFAFPSGHTTGPTWTLPFGVQARITTSPAALIIEEAAVE
jgi:muramoyltetrapeptide carboxypeptidase